MRSSVFGMARPTEPGAVPRSRSGMVAPQVVSVRPQPWPTAARGNRRATARWSSAGNGAPPDTISSTCGRSGPSMSARMSGGAPISTVARWRAASSK